jgi:hypothetical protein
MITKDTLLRVLDEYLDELLGPHVIVHHMHEMLMLVVAFELDYHRHHHCVGERRDLVRFRDETMAQLCSLIQLFDFSDEDFLWEVSRDYLPSLELFAEFTRKYVEYLRELRERCRSNGIDMFAGSPFADRKLSFCNFVVLAEMVEQEIWRLKSEDEESEETEETSHLASA